MPGFAKLPPQVKFDMELELGLANQTDFKDLTVQKQIPVDPVTVTVQLKDSTTTEVRFDQLGCKSLHWSMDDVHSIHSSKPIQISVSGLGALGKFLDEVPLVLQIKSIRLQGIDISATLENSNWRVDGTRLVVFTLPSYVWLVEQKKLIQNFYSFIKNHKL